MVREQDCHKILYGGRDFELSISQPHKVDRLGRRDAGDIDEARILRDAIAAPIAAPSIREFLATKTAPLIVINDWTRTTPSGRMLATLLPHLTQSPSWSVIVATGLHQAPNEAQLRRLLDSTYETVRPRLAIHSGRDRSLTQDFVGPDGAIPLNRALFATDGIIVLTSVEPHFFAGYTGGRKSFIPGLAGERVIEQSHAGAMQAIAAPLVVNGNPVRDFIHRNTHFTPTANIWSLQAVLDRRDRIGAAFAGEIDKTFARAVPAARNYYAHDISAPYDIVLSAVHPPLDVSLYQAQKGWEHSLTGVKKGGALIVAAACPDGIGSYFYEELGNRYPDPSRWHELEDQTYTMGLHKLVRTARANSRVRLLAATGMSPEVVKRYGYEPHPDPQAALDTALADYPTGARVLIVEDGALTTLICDDNEVGFP